jgi:hypothetical protein
LVTAVAVETFWPSASARIGRRSAWKRPTSSAAMCWASAAEPPLPHSISVPPRFSRATTNAATSAISSDISARRA